MREKPIANMTDNLPALPKKLGIRQKIFTVLIGVDRSTVAAMDNLNQTIY